MNIHLCGLQLLRKSSRAPVSWSSLLCLTALTLVPVIFVPVNAFASGGAHHEPSIAHLKHPWINFITYAVLLYILAAKPLKAAWIHRSDAIRKDVESAQAELTRAEKLLQEVEESTRNVKTRQADLVRELIAQGEAEALAIIADANTKAGRIAHQAQELIAGESRAAHTALRREMIAKAESIARAQFASGSMAHRNAAYIDAALHSANRLVN